LFKLKKKSICINVKNVKGNAIYWGSKWRYLTVAQWIQQEEQNKLIGVFIKNRNGIQMIPHVGLI
jgi:hypothetical protein